MTDCDVTITNTNGISVNKSSNNTMSYFGWSAIGSNYNSSNNTGYNGYAYFSHVDNASGDGNYAVLQDSDGNTFLNAASTRTLNFRINNGSSAYYDGSTWYAPAFSATSDLRLKENIKPLDKSLDKICLLQGVEFNFKSNKNKKMIGLIAQDVEKVIPEVVNTDDSEDNYKSINYCNITAVLIESIKELREEVKSLKQEIDILKNDKKV